MQSFHQPCYITASPVLFSFRCLLEPHSVYPAVCLFTCTAPVHRFIYRSFCRSQTCLILTTSPQNRSSLSAGGPSAHCSGTGPFLRSLHLWHSSSMCFDVHCPALRRIRSHMGFVEKESASRAARHHLRHLAGHFPAFSLRPRLSILFLPT